MKKQPAHGCMPADRIICRTWEHTNRALIFQSVPGCPKCPAVPTDRKWDNGQVGQHGTSGTVRETKQAELFTGYGKEENKA